jgi:uncharacterized membrane protein YozB (DUF420 family)
LQFILQVIKNGRYIDDPFTHISIWHNMSTTPENTLIRIDAASSMLNRKRRDQHLSIIVANIINKSYFLIIYVNNQHVIKDIESRPAITWEFYHYLFLKLLAILCYRCKLEFSLTAKIHYYIAFIIYLKELHGKLLGLNSMKYLMI